MPLLARRRCTGSHYGPCMHRGTGLNGAAGPVSRALVMIVRLNRGSSTDLGARSWESGPGRTEGGANCLVQRADRGMPAGPEVPAVSLRMP